MTRHPLATRRDEHATTLVAPSSRARRDLQPTDQVTRPIRDERDERDDEITALTPAPPVSRTVLDGHEGARSR
jgi:hypothetical protein